MNNTVTVKSAFHVRRRGNGRKQIASGEPPREPGNGVPRVAKLMALAIRFDQLIRDGVVANQAELARMGHVTRSRATQIMNLLNLAPDIQEEVLFLKPLPGRERVAERLLRPIVAEMDWRKQRKMWRALFGKRWPSRFHSPIQSFSNRGKNATSLGN